MPPSSAQYTLPISAATEELITPPLPTTSPRISRAPTRRARARRRRTAPPALARLLAASPIPDPAVEDHLARRAVEDVLEVRVPLRLSTRDDQNVLGPGRPRRPEE